MKYVDIDWKPNKDSNIPMYRQIVDYITKKISGGDWAIGQKLPPQRLLAEMFGVNRSTIVTATEELLSYDLIESDFGKGTYVKSNTWSLLMTTPPDWGKYVASGSFEENWDTVIVLNELVANTDYIDLGTGELPPSLFPSNLIDTINDSLSDKYKALDFAEPRGLPELRVELAKMLRGKDIDAKPENILITSGSIQALHLISVGMLRKGDYIYSESPSYILSLQVFESAGVEIDPVPMDSEGISTRSIKSKQRSLKSTPKLLYTIPNFQSPTGITMSEERRKDLFKFCQNEQLPIIEDDIYGNIYFDEQPPRSLKSMDTSGMVLYVGTFSTMLAPGLRVGWIVGPESVIKRLSDVKQQMDYGASSLSQMIACNFLRSCDYERHMDKVRSEVKSKKDHMIKELKKHLSKYATWIEPEGGLHMWITFKNEIDMNELFKEAISRKLIMAPGYIYEKTKNNSIRLTFSYAYKDEISKGIKIIKDIVKKYYD